MAKRKKRSPSRSTEVKPASVTTQTPLKQPTSQIQPASGMKQQRGWLSKWKAGRTSAHSASSPAKTTDGEAKPQRREQILQAWRIAKEYDRSLVWLLPLIFLAVVAVFLVVGLLVNAPIPLGILGALVALLVVTIVFGRRAEAAAYSQIEGQPGAAAAILTNMRGAWTVTPAVAGTRSGDVVHRVIGRCGVLLVGEGPPGSNNRLPALFTQEKRRLHRVGIEQIPITTVIVGVQENQLRVKKLQRYIRKLPRSVKPAQVTEIDRRLAALGTPATTLPGLPKGPLPRNVKMPKMPKGMR